MPGNQGDGDPFGRVGDRLKTIFRRTREESVRLGNVARIQLDLNGLKGRRERAIRELGEEVYRLLRDGKCAIPHLQPLVEEILSHDRRIAEGEAKIESLRLGREGKESAGEGAQGPPPGRP